MKTKGLQRREEKEIIRQQKAESKKAAAFESTLLDILPTLDQSIGYDSGGFYTEIWAEKNRKVCDRLKYFEDQIQRLTNSVPQIDVGRFCSYK